WQRLFGEVIGLDRSRYWRIRFSAIPCALSSERNQQSGSADADCPHRLRYAIGQHVCFTWPILDRAA
ncbi:MAG: hypothetical protein ACRYHA_26030, partial [Janthinobacterium lividum]